MDKVLFFIYHADMGILYHQFLVFYLIITFSFCASQLLKNRTLLFFVYLTYCRSVAYIVGFRSDGTTFFAFSCSKSKSQTRSSLRPFCGLNFPIASTNRKKHHHRRIASQGNYLFFSFLFYKNAYESSFVTFRSDRVYLNWEQSQIETRIAGYYSRVRPVPLAFFQPLSLFLPSSLRLYSFFPFLFSDGYILCVNPRSRLVSRRTQWSFALKVISLNVRLPVAQPAQFTDSLLASERISERNNCADFFVRLPFFPRTHSRYSFSFPFISALPLILPVSSLGASNRFRRN